MPLGQWHGIKNIPISINLPICPIQWTNVDESLCIAVSTMYNHINFFFENWFCPNFLTPIDCILWSVSCMLNTSNFCLFSMARYMYLHDLRVLEGVRLGRPEREDWRLWPWPDPFKEGLPSFPLSLLTLLLALLTKKRNRKSYIN